MIFTVASINVSHLLSLVVFIGAVLVVDLRLLGSGMRRQTALRGRAGARRRGCGRLHRDGHDRIAAGRRNPMKAYFSDQFWLKCSS
jgi:hypothetical protein